MDKDSEQRVIKLLKSNPKGSTMIELARATGYSTHTVAIALARLEGAKKIEIRRAGSAKLHYWIK